MIHCNTIVKIFKNVWNKVMKKKNYNAFVKQCKILRMREIIKAASHARKTVQSLYPPPFPICPLNGKNTLTFYFYLLFFFK